MVKIRMPWIMGLMLWLLICPKLAASVLTIEVTSSQVAALPVAVVPFESDVDGLDAEDAALIIHKNLARSGQFRVLERALMLSRPTEKSQLVYRDWRVLDVAYVVIGSVQRQRDNYQLSFKLFDIYQGAEVPLDISSIADVNLRRGAHRVSDLIYQQLTGTPGAFATQILYVTSIRMNHSQVFTLQKADADGGQVKTLFSSVEPILSPTWSPDGSEVAYVSYETGRSGIYVHDLASGERERLTGFRGINGAPTWSPDGQFMAMTLSKDGNPEIYQLHLGSGRLDRLTRHYAIDTEPRYAPDGRSLIFTSNRAGSPQIYRLFLEDLSVERLTFEGDYNARGLLTQDSKHLVMVHRNGGNFHVGVQRLGTFAVNTLTQTSLDESPTIAPNGTMLLYATYEQGQGLLSGVSLDGRIHVRLPAQVGVVREPAWSPFLPNLSESF